MFECLEDLDDVVCFCLADRALFAVGLKQVLALQKATVAPWAGNALDNYKANDLPASLAAYPDSRHDDGLWRLAYNTYHQIPELSDEEEEEEPQPLLQPRHDAEFVRK